MAKKIVNDRFRFSDNIIFGCLMGIWGTLLVFGIFTLLQPKWLVNLSKPGRTEEAMTNINAGNSYLYNARQNNSIKDLQLALTNYQKALEIDPSNYEAMANLGITYLYLNKVDEAQATFEKCLKTDTNSAFHSYAYLGDLYEKKGNIEKALEYYLLSAEKHPDPSYPLRKAGLFSMRLGKSDDAISYLKESIELTKSFENLYKATLMEARYKLTRDNDTVNLKVIDKELQKADFSEDVKRYDKNIFEQTQQSSKDLGYAYMYLGDAYFFKTAFKEAAEYYELSIHYFPSLGEKFKDKLAFASANSTKQQPPQ
ncbi:MAG TPA: tetratricopeptide repeat protein [Bacteroidales bacterium]|nr:tetratricopeptide repeat protein [Bacteroidales bacterium]